MAKTGNPTLLVVAIGVYAAIAVSYLAVPPANLPHGAIGKSLMGPPALLLCGGKAWPFFFGITLVFFGLLYLALRESAARIPAILAAGLIWILSGYFSAALSV